MEKNYDETQGEKTKAAADKKERAEKAKEKPAVLGFKQERAPDSDSDRDRNDCSESRPSCSSGFQLPGSTQGWKSRTPGVWHSAAHGYDASDRQACPSGIERAR